MEYTAIILAAGKGHRMNLNFNKILFEINAVRVIDYSLKFFEKDDNCKEIILVVSKEDFSQMYKDYDNRVDQLLIGGSQRQQSVFIALKVAVSDYVLIHDGARPFISKSCISDICSNLDTFPSITLGVEVKETIQEVLGNRVVKTLDRNTLIITQTPQGFDKDMLLKAHKLAIKDGYIGTDDTVLIEKYLDIKAFIVKGDYRNIKLTTVDDIKLLEVILNENRA